MSNSILKNGFIYSIAQLIAAISGLISFPVITKNLSVEDYGAVALFTTTLGLLTSFNKFGVQHSMIRYYKELNYQTYISNISSIIAISLGSSAFLIITVGVLLSYTSDVYLFTPWPLTILFFSANLQSLQSFYINFLVAQEKSKSVAVITSCYRILSMSTVVIAILFIEPTFAKFIASILVADILLLFIVIYRIYKGKVLSNFKFNQISSELCKSMFIFGLPMMGYELANMIHAFSDRILIEWFLDSYHLGLYTAPYNMAMIIGGLLLTGLSTAVVPHYINLWHTQGKVATEQSLSEINRFLILLIPPVIAGLYSISEALLNLLATEKYAENYYLLPIIAVGVILYNCSILYAAGLQIKKDSKKIFRFVFESTILNLILNIIFIPQYGIIAAAASSVISYSWMATRFYFEGRKTLEINFDLFLLFRSIAYSIIMTTCIIQITHTSHFMEIIIKLSVGFSIFTVLVLSFEKKIRALFYKILCR